MISEYSDTTSLADHQKENKNENGDNESTEVEKWNSTVQSIQSDRILNSKSILDKLDCVNNIIYSLFTSPLCQIQEPCECDPKRMIAIRF